MYFALKTPPGSLNQRGAWERVSRSSALLGGGGKSIKASREETPNFAPVGPLAAAAGARQTPQKAGGRGGAAGARVFPFYSASFP